MRAVLFLLTATIVAALTSVLPASGPTFWTVATAAEFLRGTSDGVYVTLGGVLTAGPQATNRLSTAPAQIWSIVSTPDGTVWAGTGGDGRVIRLRPGQAEETVFDSLENHVFAIAVAGARVYAATSPDGRVYVIENGAARPFFDPPEKYIWALSVDALGRLWVGAGSPAVIHRVDAAGAGAVLYRPPASHVVTFGRDIDGRMLAGTESPGRLYRFDATDRPFVMLDSGLTELRAISSDRNGVIFAAGVARDDASPAGETASVSVSLAPDPPAEGASTGAAATARRSVLFRIDPNGTWEDIWSTADVIFDVAAQNDGGVLVATGNEGRLYKIDRGRDVFLLTGVDARQITRFSASESTGSLSYFATANPGRVIAVGTGVQSSATYYSSVRDTRSVATWGLMRWETTAPVALFTRSGNTEVPDDSWSEWSGPLTRPQGELIMSPPARFLQWKATFTARPGAPPAELTAVTVAYLARNSRPVVSAITVYPPGVVFQRPYVSDDAAIAGLDEAIADSRRPPGDTGPPPPTPQRRMFQKGLQTVTWRGEDADADRLIYSLQYRREGDQTWRELKSNVADTIFVWDTTVVADGRYVIRVRASDFPSNANDRALAGERESDPIDVDNTPASLTAQIVRRPSGARLLVNVVDARSPILKVEYSLAGGPWQLVYPADGLADAPEERYEIPLSNDTDASRIVIRVTDLLQNVMSQPAIR